MSIPAGQTAAQPASEEVHTTTTAWQRLSARIIWVDLAISILSILPAAVAIWVFDVDAAGGQIWPLIGLAAFGVLGAIFDVMRWVFTRFRVTPKYVELKTGVFLRQHRSIQRDRIRSVDIKAKLRHRLARMRVVNIGAGQQTAAGESALSLDALSAEGALSLQNSLLHGEASAAGTLSLSPSAEETPDAARETPSTDADAEEAGNLDVPLAAGEPVRVFARFEPTWFIYNMFNIWAYALALGFGWGALWLLSTVGLDFYGFVVGLLDWESIGWIGTVLIALVVIGGLGAVGLGINYFTENWNFELARVPGREATMLRTRKGLFTIREVNRDENRIRGAQISEPVLWRWVGVSDTSVITTGLNAWSMSEPAAILPPRPGQPCTRGRRSGARRFGEPLLQALESTPTAGAAASALVGDSIGRARRWGADLAGGHRCSLPPVDLGRSSGVAGESAGCRDRLPGSGAHDHRPVRHHPFRTAEPGDHRAAALGGQHHCGAGVPAAAAAEPAQRLHHDSCRIRRLRHPRPPAGAQPGVRGAGGPGTAGPFSGAPG